MDYRDLSQESLIVYYKIQAAGWAQEKRDRTMEQAGLHIVGCPLCGEQDTCPRCGKCYLHHTTVIDTLGEEETTDLAVAGFISSYCRASPSDLMSALSALAHPEDRIAEYRQPCPYEWDEEEGDSLGLDFDIWGQFFEDE